MVWEVAVGQLPQVLLACNFSFSSTESNNYSSSNSKEDHSRSCLIHSLR